MAAHGVNAVRTYTPPPRWLLDLASQYRLRVMVGLPADRPGAFLEDAAQCRDVRQQVQQAVEACAGHSAVLCYAVGNELPAPIVRWHGRRRVESFLRDLCSLVKDRDPGALVTYVNYPTTEYLELPFLDLVAFNVYLESRDRLEAYLARLHNLADERPLLLAEIGLDSLRNGEQTQAHQLDWQLRSAFEAGCAGAFVFSWTSEWFRGGLDIEDWDFGLTTRERSPKPALETVRKAFAQVPASFEDSPRVSVIVCSYNGEATIRDTMEGLAGLEYPNFDVIVVNDGSTDTTAEIAAQYDVRLISTPNRGLSSARNTGYRAATGEIVAYIDDDAYPDPHWLTYLVQRFQESDVCGVGGPNLPPPEDGPLADCVAHAPGGPCHVLLSDREAEHIPGCNMAFRRSWLERVGGFDTRFRVAGDDVDLCWRLQEEGGVLGFHAAAVVWHHRRPSIRRYWKQQIGYGKAEALLSRKWPQKYNSIGHIGWSGRIYGRGLTLPALEGTQRLYQGVWGSAPFQSVYQKAPGRLSSLPLLPEWYLLIAAFALFSALGLLWPPLLAALPLLGIALALPLAQALRSAARARLPSSSAWLRARQRCVISLLHCMQPAARLYGRLRHGLDPWRLRRMSGWLIPRGRELSLWSEDWKAHASWLESLEEALRSTRVLVRHGGEFDDFDLSLARGPLGGARVLMAVEEHGQGRQNVRLRCRPRMRGVTAAVAFVAVAVLAALEAAWPATSVLLAGSIGLTLASLIEAGAAQADVRRALEGLESPVLAEARQELPKAQTGAAAAPDAVPLGHAR
jgi:GT2 family glycosyltransferase